MIGFIVGCMVGGFSQCAFAEQRQMPINVWIQQIPINKFVRFGDTIPAENVVFLLSERSVKICRQ